MDMVSAISFLVFQATNYPEISTTNMPVHDMSILLMPHAQPITAWPPSLHYVTINYKLCQYVMSSISH